MSMDENLIEIDNSIARAQHLGLGIILNEQEDQGTIPTLFNMIETKPELKAGLWWMLEGFRDLKDLLVLCILSIADDTRVHNVCM